MAATNRFIATNPWPEPESIGPETKDVRRRWLVGVRRSYQGDLLSELKLADTSDLTLSPLDEHYIEVSIRSPNPETCDPHALVQRTREVMFRIDHEWGLESLQRIPAIKWLFFQMGWNEPVWTQMAITPEPMAVDVGSAAKAVTFLGMGSAIVSDKDGQAVRTVRVRLGYAEVEVPESSRIERFGQATWVNLAAWHLLDVVARLSLTRDEDLVSKTKWALMKCEQRAVDGLVGPALQRLFVFRDPTEQATLYIGVRDELAKRLRPFRAEVAEYLCRMVAKYFGGDPETLLATWPRP